MHPLKKIVYYIYAKFRSCRSYGGIEQFHLNSIEIQMANILLKIENWDACNFCIKLTSPIFACLFPQCIITEDFARVFYCTVRFAIYNGLHSIFK
jgi:hypothetical protein